MKTCKDCKAEGRTGKPLNIVYLKNGKPAPGPRCFNHHRKFRRELLEKQAAIRLMKTYQMAADRYQAIVDIQGGGCGICGRPRRKGGRRLAVDHDHACCPGKETCGQCTRGMLCWSCNSFLEHIDDNIQTLERAIEYLKNPPAKRLTLAPTTTGHVD